MKRETISKYTKIGIPGVFVFLYFFVSTISAIHVIDFFQLSNTKAMSIALAVAFEIGAAASLASIIIMERMNKWIVWCLFIILTSMQCMGNMYNSYSHLIDFKNWIELFGLTDEPIMVQKRILAIVSGAILPIVALGFIKALVDYLKIDKETVNFETDDSKLQKIYQDIRKDIKNENKELNAQQKTDYDKSYEKIKDNNANEVDESKKK